MIDWILRRLTEWAARVDAESLAEESLAEAWRQRWEGLCENLRKMLPAPYADEIIFGPSRAGPAYPALFAAPLEVDRLRKENTQLRLKLDELRARIEESETES